MGLYCGWDEESRDRQHRLALLLLICLLVVSTIALISSDPAPGEPGFTPTGTTEATP